MTRLASVFLALLVTACGGGPNADALSKDVTARLGDALPAGTVSLEAIHRRGTQSDVKAPSGETRRIVYYDVDLKLAKNYDFGAWDSPGVAGLVSALGTGPKGLVGIVSGGNKTGDVIRAHGAAVYRREGDTWVSAAPEGYRPVEAPAIATGAPREGPERLIEAMRKVIEGAPPDMAPATREVIVEELQAANAAIRARLARVADGYAIAAGAESGQYLRFVQALPSGKTRVIPLVTAGGEENLRLLREGKVSLAMAQSDSAQQALEGKGPFAEEGPYPTLRAIGSLYPEAIHVIVRRDSAIRSVSDLVGKRVAIGVPGSASRTTAIAVLDAHGIPTNRLGKAMEISLGAALVALRQNSLDAVIQVIGFPADSVRDAAADTPLRLVPLDERAVRAMAARTPALFELTLPKGTYAGQSSDVRTVATAAILAVSADMTDSEVAALTRLIYTTGNSMVARGSAQGAQLAASRARQGLAAPMHVAAARVIDELTKP